MPHERIRPGYAFGEDRIEQLKSIVPEAFTDGKINWDVLREALGEYVEPETGEVQHFGLSWPGKREARRLANAPSEGNLVPCSGEGVDEEKTRNIFIEGDNLEVLKLLQKSYAGKIRMIYIDPPYNTGNDFIYKDDFDEPLMYYLSRTGQLNEEGLTLATNPKVSGRFHSNWLNMMYPRILVARSLLSEDGVIFVSIDDNEVQHLRMIMNEVFGEENLVVQIAWQSRQSVQNDTDISVNHEYILVYAKARRQSEHRLKPSNVDRWYDVPGFAAYPLPLEKKGFSNPDNDPRGDWQVNPFDAPGVRPNLTYEIVNPNTGTGYMPPPGRHWGVPEPTYRKLLRDGRIVFGKTGMAGPQLKAFYGEREAFGRVENTWFSGDKHGTATHGTKEVQSLFEGNKVFDSPKPSSLIESLLRISTRDEDIVMDFFAGSCTTAHAVLDLNKDDGGNRKFIMVQIPEMVPEDSVAKKMGYLTISEIGKERIRRVIVSHREAAVERDNGFKVFKLEPSSFRAWPDYLGDDIQQMQVLLDGAETPLVDGWTRDSLLTEVMLIQGFPLDSTITQQTGYTRNTVQLVTSPALDHRLLVCLDERIHDETIELLKLHGEDTFVCLDSALSDQAKVSLSDKCNLATI